MFICVFCYLAIKVSSGRSSLEARGIGECQFTHTYVDAYQTDTPMIEINKNDISVYIYDLLHY